MIFASAKAGCIEAGQPHVANDHDLEGVLGVLETVRQFAPRIFAADVLLPVGAVFGAGEAGEEILIHAAEQIDGAMSLLALAGGGEADGGDEVDEFAEAVFVEAGAGVVLGQDAFEARIVTLDGDHGVVHDFADGGLFGFGLKVRPAGIGRNPKHIFGDVFVGVLGVGVLVRNELCVMFLKGVRDVLEEDEA